MFKKRIKAKIIACVLVCILPTISCALDKDEFIQFLINSSYPESKTKEKDETSKTDKEGSKEQDTADKENNASSSKEEDYIKFHIGEENVPDINPTTEPANGIQVSNNRDYKDDLRVTKENPSVLIYHTHSSETYSESPAGNYHSQDKPNSVMSVGTSLTDELSKKGWGVAHTTKYNDLDYNTSYQTSLKTIQNLTSKYESIDIAIDVHREGRDIYDEAVKKKEHDKYTTTINGERVAKFFFVIGPKNDNFNELKKIADDITRLAEAKYPGITIPVLVKPYGNFNQFVAKNHMLIEIGTNAVSIKEAKASTKYIANVFDEYFKDYK